MVFDIIGENSYVVQGKSSTYNLNLTSCECNFMKKMQLPCRHLFSLRRSLSLPSFVRSAANQRWTRAYYNDALDVRFQSNGTQHADDIKNASELTVSENKSHSKCYTQAAKFRKLMKIGQQLASVGSEVGMKVYLQREAQILNNLSHWQRGKEICVLGASDIDISATTSSMNMNVIDLQQVHTDHQGEGVDQEHKQDK